MELELSTPCGKWRKGGGNRQEEKRTSAEQDRALLRTGGLTPIMLVIKVHDTAHAHSTGNLHQESRDQAGASRAGVGLQPPTSAADSDGADGADAALHRGHCGRVPPPLARARARGRSLRSRGRRAIAGASRAKDSPLVARPAKVALPAEGTLEGSPRSRDLPPILHRRVKLQRAPDLRGVGGGLAKSCRRAGRAVYADESSQFVVRSSEQQFLPTTNSNNEL